MRQFKKNSGLRGFFREDGGWQYTGAAMGRASNTRTDIFGQHVKLRVRRVRLDSGGYDDGGAYWGAGVPLWQARGETEEESLNIYTRAATKAEAIASFRSNYAPYASSFSIR